MSKLRQVILDHLAAIMIVAAASIIRFMFLSSLGRATPYLTYYPAVMLAAYLGGLYPGLNSVLLSALVSLLWVQEGKMSPVETLAMGFFIFSSSMIALITEAMRRANARAQKAQLAAEASSRAKSVFLSNMSHELRTPLNAILGFSNLMQQDTSLSKSNRDTLSIINHSGEHLLSLINDVLDMAKIESGRIEIEKIDFELREFVFEIYKLMKIRADEKGVNLQIEQLPDRPVFLRMDGVKLRQVLINLIGNAIKFTPIGSVRLYFEIVYSDFDAPASLNFRVQDTGIGITPEDQTKIFEPFVQVSGLTNVKGTGLGLAISRKYIELMDGEIQVTSEPGQGSTFEVRIPVEAAEHVPNQTWIENQNRILSVSPGDSNRRILIVEDQMENWLLLKQLMERSGLQARVAENGALGVAAFQEWEPELIWMDIRMPVMDGLEAASQIRKLPGGDKVKIIALSASVFNEERERIVAVGFDEFVRKPYRIVEIYDCLARHLNLTYHENQTQAGETAIAAQTINPADLISLPPAWQTEMINALIALDINQINTLIEQVAEMNPALANAMTGYAETYNFTPLLETLQSIHGTLLEEDQ